MNLPKTDNELALTSLIASWSTMRAMTSGSRMIIENCPVGNLKSNGIVVRAIQSVQGMIRTIRRNDAFNLAVDRTTRKILVDEVRGRTRWEDRAPRAWHLLKESCGIGSEHERSSWEIETARVDENCSAAKERWDGSDLEMVVAVPLRNKEDGPKMDGERLKSEVIVMDQEYIQRKFGSRRTCPRSECTFHVKIWRNSDSQRDVGGACRCFGELPDKHIPKVVEGESKKSCRAQRRHTRRRDA